MQMIWRAYTRALAAQFSPRILLLGLLPFLLALILWGGLLYAGLQPTIDAVHAYFDANDGFRMSRGMLESFGLGAFKTIIVPLLAMWCLLPPMIVTALLFVALFAVPAVVRYCTRSHFPDLEQRRGGSLLGGLWVALSSFALFAVLYLLTLPLGALVPLAVLVHSSLFAWLTSRVMSYDALSLHADAQELRAIRRLHRVPLLAIGFCAGLLGFIPTMLWLSGPMAVVFFPVLAALAILLYVLVFNFTALWFTYYCLDALHRHRLAPPERLIHPAP
ncbi:MAG TPA: EI24 domain-containing protein [Burkholderiaceae bacterium]